MSLKVEQLHPGILAQHQTPAVIILLLLLPIQQEAHGQVSLP
jgi:hypothetical protein